MMASLEKSNSWVATTIGFLFSSLLWTSTAVASERGIAELVVRERIAGIDVLVYRTEAKDVVTVMGALPAGNAHAGDGNLAAATLVGTMLDRGTTRQSKLVIAQQLEDAGAEFFFDVSSQRTTIEARLLKQDLALVIGLLAEQLRMPAFDPQEFEHARAQFIGSLQVAHNDVGRRASEAFFRGMYPPGHPNRPASINELMAAAQTLTLPEIAAFHASHYGSRNLTLVFVGDVDPTTVKAEIVKSFASWDGGSEYRKPSAPAIAGSAITVPVEVPDKSSVTILLGQATGLKSNHPEALALQLGTTVLGSGFTGRLMSALRDDEGLTYGIGANISGNTFTDGHWLIDATFSPELLDKGIVSTQRELGHWWREGITADELSARKQQLVGTYRIGLSNTEGIASVILDVVLAGRDLSWLDEYSRAIDALTLHQVNSAIREYLDPAKMILVKAGTLPSEQPAALRQSQGRASQ